MSTLSVPLTPNLEAFINSMVKRGDAANKADVVRKALRRYSEDQAVEAMLRAQQELKEGKEIRGDIREILAQL